MNRIVSLLAVSVLTGLAHAQHAGDVALRVQGGVMETGLAPEAGGDAIYPVRVFGAEFGEFAPDFTDEPGFASLPAAFAPGSSLRFRVLEPLRAWDGSAFPSAAGGELRIEFAGQFIQTPAAGAIDGFPLSVGANGEFHRHLEFTLLPPASVGVYLLSLEWHSDDPGVGPSAPLWIVFNQSSDEATHDAAIEWAACNLAGVCPCDPDVNADGNVDQGDIDYLVNVIGGGENLTGIDPDFNRDGNADQGDVSALIDVVAGGACP